jgi:hypothetical protein
VSSETPRTVTEEWKWLRREVIIRDEYTCQDCGEKGAVKGPAQLEVHHITPVSEGGSDDKQNLVTLCDSCHSDKHATEPGEPVEKDNSGRWHDQNGKFAKTYDTERFLSEIRDSEGMTGTQDVADAVGCEYETAYKRLRKLAEEGTVDSEKVANARVWFVDDGGDAAETETESDAEADNHR